MSLEIELANLLHKHDCTGREFAEVALRVAAGHCETATDLALMDGDDLTRRRQALARARGREVRSA